jgi:ABC-type transport system involved in multi-copper enzyme maturation permease subunit
MKIFAIALTTGREALRNKVLYAIVLFAALVVGVAALFGSASIGNQMKFVKDFSLMAISLFGAVIATVLGAGMLHKELGRRTIFNVLSKPVARWEFLAGKFLGLLATLTAVVAGMSAALVGILAAVEGRVDTGLIAASAMSLLELTIVVGVALCVSAVCVTPTVVGLVTAAAFVAGRSAGYLDFFLRDDTAGALRVVARGLWWIVPHLDWLNVSNHVVYGDPIGAGRLVAAVVYAGAYTGVLFCLSVAAFSRREFI